MPEFKSYLRAGYPALYIQTVEADRAFEMLGKEVLIVSGTPVFWKETKGQLEGERR